MSSRSDFTVVSAFAGCGGSSLGYKWAGGRVVCAIEFDRNAAETYRLNFPETLIIERDIATVIAGEVLSLTGMSPGQLDVLDGSPPCQGFSIAGKRQFADPRNGLFWEFVRLIEGLQPRAFVMENVSGLVKGKMKLAFQAIMQALKATGYRVRCQLLNAMWFGVPQSRERLIWIGAREDLEIEPIFPEPEAMIPLRSVVPCCASSIAYSSFSPYWRSADLPSATIRAAGPGKMSGLMIPLSGSAEWRKLQSGQKSRQYVSLQRPDPNKPCPTVTSIGGEFKSAACVTHPIECRKFTIPELKRICSFPDDFKLRGSFGDRWRVLGNSVPPRFMRAIAECVRDTILFPDTARAVA